MAYRTAAGRQYKKYLGTVADLTPEHLAERPRRWLSASPTRRDASVSATGSSGSPGRMAQNAAGLLLATKLFVPRPRPDLVPRPRLLALLDEGLDDGRCSLLSAPAGAGKTSLLATWVASLARPVAWLALDERDQEVHQVLRYLVASIQTIAPDVRPYGVGSARRAADGAARDRAHQPAQRPGRPAQAPRSGLGRLPRGASAGCPCRD